MAVRHVRSLVLTGLAVVLVGALMRAADAPATGVITTVAGTGVQGFSGDTGAATAARLAGPGGLAIDGSGNLYIADSTNNRVRKLTVATGVITTVAGSGSTGDLSGGFAGDGGLATSARLWGPTSVAVDTAGNLYIADRRNHRIRKVTASTGIITTVAGSSATAGFGGDTGAATAALLSSPWGVAVDTSGNIYIGDYGNNRVRKVTASTGLITTIAGTGALAAAGSCTEGAATSQNLAEPAGVAVDASGHVYIADYSSSCIRRIDAVTGVLSTVAGTGTAGYSGEAGAATLARLDSPVALAVDGDGNLFIADQLNNRIRKLDRTTGLLVTVVGSGTTGSSGDDGAAAAASLSQPSGVAVLSDGTLYVADSGSHRVRRVVAGGEVPRLMSTLAGTGAETFSGDGGAASSAAVWNPYGVGVDSAGNVYIADRSNLRVRRVDATTGIITTVAGNGTDDTTCAAGPVTATSAALGGPVSIAIDSTGNVYFADHRAHCIRKLTVSTGILTRVAGNGTEADAGDGGLAVNASFLGAEGIAVDASGNLYIADRSAFRIRKVTAADGIIRTIAGTGAPGFSGDGGPATSATLTDATDVAVDSSGNVYIADRSNHRVRRVDVVTGNISTVAGTGTAGYSGENVAATSAQLSSPYSLAVDASGHVYIADTANRRIRKLDVGTGRITTVAGAAGPTTLASGDGGAAIAATFRQPIRVAVDAAGSLYIADDLDDRVRKAGNPPQFTASPSSQSVVVGATATFTCAASGSPTFQWQLSTGGVFSNLSNGAPYSGVTTGTLTITGAEAGISGARYRCAATNAIATSYSTAATLTVSTPSAPVFTTQPAAATITAGQNTSFTVSVSGTPTPTLQWQVSSDGGSTFTNLANTAPYSGVTLSTLTITAAPVGLHGGRYRVVATNSVGSATSTAVALSVRGSVSASPAALVFQAIKSGATGPITAVTSTQTVTVNFAGAGSTWTASVAVPWLRVTSGSGAGAGQFGVDIDTTGIDFGSTTSFSGEVTVSAPTAPNLSVSVPITLRVINDGTPTAAPIGQVDTPVQGATGVQGAIAMTGWVVDDVGIEHVRVFRQCLDFDVPAACQTVLGSSVVFVGQASIIAGARPDVEALYPAYPAANTAGWGFLILSNLLPHIPDRSSAGGGVGTFVLTAVATDRDGNQKVLGRTTGDSTPTTVTAANDTIARPFGAIDTPGQGATVSGTLNNFGWAITPDPGSGVLIATSGATVRVFVDGALLGTATYNLCRGSVGNPVPAGVLCDDDVSTIFRGAGTLFRNLDPARGPIGLRAIDTTTLTNGLHTIQWGVSDSGSRSEGIGSRYFTVLNSASDADPGRGGWRQVAAGGGGLPVVPRPDLAAKPVADIAVYGRTGFDVDRAFVPVEAVAGVPTVRVPEMGRVELQIPGATEVALLANGEVRAAPVGMSVDPETGTVAWSVGPGYLGTYRLLVQGPGSRVQGPIVDVVVAPMAVVEEPVRMHLDRVDSAPRTSHFALHGWALDPQADTGAGIGAVHVWASRRSAECGVRSADGEPRTADCGPIFLGVADLGVDRPDVAAAHGARFPQAGFTFQGVLGDGEWDVTAYVWNIRTQRFEDARTITVVVR